MDAKQLEVDAQALVDVKFGRSAFGPNIIVELTEIDGGYQVVVREGGNHDHDLNPPQRAIDFVLTTLRELEPDGHFELDPCVQSAESVRGTELEEPEI